MTDDRRSLRVLHQRPGNRARLHRAERSIEQRERLEHQAARAAEAGRDFWSRSNMACRRRRHGMALTTVHDAARQESIRDVILFPQLKPK